MKKFYLLLSAIAVLFFSCKEDNNDLVVKPDTSLEITFKDNLGNNLQDVVVKLYSSQADWANGTNQVGEVKYSNSEGKVRFDNLSGIKYYWFAQKGCVNNVNGSVTTVSPIAEGKINTVSSVLTSTGTLTFTSTSSNPYRIYVNGTAVFDMPGGTTRSIYFAPTGSYSLRVLQLSGYLVYPTDKTYTDNLTCGGTLNTTFP